MSDEEQPLLNTAISHIEPVADDQSFIPRRPSRISVTWRQAKRLDSPISNWLLYPVFWLALWFILAIQSFQGVCYRSPCKLCRKRSGTVDQLVVSSFDGCHYCALYAEVLATIAPQIQPDVGLFTLKSESWFKRFPIELSAWNVGGFEAARLRLLALKVSKEGDLNCPGSFKVPRDSGSDESMSFALKAVEDCVKHHKGCRNSKRSPLPRRVVDVCNFNTISDVRLYESHGKRAKYVALSHSWGQKHTFMTKVSNLSEWKRGIKLESLPKTFQDAIFMARKLRVRYLWIDSLCIIQDHLADWEEESPKMGAIYGNAYLTIAAGSALNDQSGFLGPRSDLMYRDFALRMNIGQCVPLCRVQDMMAPDRRDPLSFRAWAFQERLLSRRTLYYHQQELLYECKQGVKCECNSCSRTVKKYRQEKPTSLERLGVSYVSRSFPKAEIPTSATKEDLQRFWQDFIVPEYSARSISRDSDRLPALSSVASAIQTLVEDNYLAGMWRNSLPSDLSWVTVHNARSRTGKRVLATLPSTYVAPSWCWTSISGPVEYKSADNTENIEYRVSIIKAECAAFGSNPFGSVKSGFLRLGGIMLHGTCELQVEPNKLWPYHIKLLYPTPSQMTLGFEPDVALLAESSLSHEDVVSIERAPEVWRRINKTLKREKVPATPEDDGIDASSAHRWSTSGGRTSYGRIRCLLLYTARQPTRCEWSFIVLGQSSRNQGKGVYERLGILTCWVNGYAEWPELDGLNPEIITIV